MNIVEVDDNWRTKIEVMPLIQAFPELTHLVKADIPEFKEFRDKKLVLSEDHERLFGVYGAKAVVIPHEDLVNILSDTYDQLYKDSEGTMNIVSLKNGAAIRIEMDLPLEKPLDIGNGDLSNLKLYAYNAYDKAFPLKIRMGVMRLICTNGAMIGDQIGSLSANELMDGWSTKSLSAKVRRLVDNSRKVTDVWQGWTDVEVPFEAARRVLEPAFPKKFIDPILDRSLFPMDMYSLYNHLTRRATHDTRTDRSRITFDTHISSLFYGNKILNAIRSNEEYSYADAADNLLQSSVLDDDISDTVTETAEITH
jgi:hypothetical protein